MAPFKSSLARTASKLLSVNNQSDLTLRGRKQVGRNVKLASVKDGVVNIDMLGACQGCPLSIATLKSGIERILMDKVPGVVEVIAT